MLRRGALIVAVMVMLTPSSSAGILRDAAVRKTAAGYEIAFTLTKPTDVTVRIVDAKGNVVRHLASGMVGLERAAKPFAPKSLSQEITWDGKDDAGKPVELNGCRAIMGVGMHAKFDRFILWEPDCFAQLSGGAIAVGPKGNLHVVNHLGVHYATLRLFDRHGKYVRSLWPFDPALPMVPKLYETWGMEDDEGRTVPISVNHSAAYWFVVHSSCVAVNPQGVVTGFVTWGGKQHWVIDNTVPVKLKNAKVPWCTHKGCTVSMAMCVGPEGDFYVADPGAQSYRKEPCGFVVARLRGAAFEPVNAFTYAGKRKLQQPRYYLGTMHETGKDEAHFERPVSVAVTRDGTVLVSDAGAIKVFGKDGLYLKRIDAVKTASGELQAGGYLAANLKTGAVYVNVPVENRRRARRVVVRIDAIDKAAAAIVSRPLDPYASQIAVDADADLVWVFQGAGKDTLLRLHDAGNRFESTVVRGKKKGGLVFPNFLAAAPDGTLYVTNRGYGEITCAGPDGKYLRSIGVGLGGMCAGAVAADRHGNLYVASTPGRWGATEQVRKFSPDGKPIPIGDKPFLEPDDTQFVKGIWVTPNGDIHLAVTVPFRNVRLPYWTGTRPPSPEHLFGRVDVYTADGALKKKGLVKLQGPNGVAVARDGSIYTVEAYAMHGATKMRWTRDHGKGSLRFRYSLIDKLLKFPPAGGDAGERSAEWIHPGIAGTSPNGCNMECCGAQVTVDDDDRVWCHDAVLYHVKALDAAGNLILRVGTYGNEDAKGGGGDTVHPGTTIPRDPEIPLARPSGVAVCGDRLFITDQFSGRVVRCRLAYENRREIAIAAVRN